MMVWAKPAPVRPSNASKHTAARQAILVRPQWAGGLAPWFLVVFPVPVLKLLPVLIVRCFSSALRVFGDREIPGARTCRALHTAPFSWTGFPCRSPAAEVALNRFYCFFL